jgi:hypothetical protein
MKCLQMEAEILCESTARLRKEIEVLRCARSERWGPAISEEGTRPARRSTPPLPRTVVRDVARPGGCMARPDRIQPWMCDREHLARPGGGRWLAG